MPIVQPTRPTLQQALYGDAAFRRLRPGGITTTTPAPESMGTIAGRLMGQGQPGGVRLTSSGATSDTHRNALHMVIDTLMALGSGVRSGLAGGIEDYRNAAGKNVETEGIGVVGGIESLLRSLNNPDDYIRGITGSITGNEEQTVTGAELLESAIGQKNFDEMNGIGRGFASLGLDIGLDPFTYGSLGLGTLGRKAIGAVAGTTRAAGREAQAAEDLANVANPNLHHPPPTGPPNNFPPPTGPPNNFPPPTGPAAPTHPPAPPNMPPPTGPAAPTVPPATHIPPPPPTAPPATHIPSPGTQAPTPTPTPGAATLQEQLDALDYGSFPVGRYEVPEQIVREVSQQVERPFIGEPGRLAGELDLPVGKSRVPIDWKSGYDPGIEGSYQLPIPTAPTLATAERVSAEAEKVLSSVGEQDAMGTLYRAPDQAGMAKLRAENAQDSIPYDTPAEQEYVDYLHRTQGAESIGDNFSLSQFASPAERYTLFGAGRAGMRKGSKYNVKVRLVSNPGRQVEIGPGEFMMLATGRFIRGGKDTIRPQDVILESQNMGQRWGNPITGQKTAQVQKLQNGQIPTFQNLANAQARVLNDPKWWQDNFLATHDLLERDPGLVRAVTRNRASALRRNVKETHAEYRKEWVAKHTAKLKEFGVPESELAVGVQALEKAFDNATAELQRMWKEIDIADPDVDFMAAVQQGQADIRKAMEDGLASITYPEVIAQEVTEILNHVRFVGVQRLELDEVHKLGGIAAVNQMDHIDDLAAQMHYEADEAAAQVADLQHARMQEILKENASNSTEMGSKLETNQILEGTSPEQLEVVQGVLNDLNIFRVAPERQVELLPHLQGWIKEGEEHFNGVTKSKIEQNERNAAQRAADKAAGRRSSRRPSDRNPNKITSIDSVNLINKMRLRLKETPYRGRNYNQGHQMATVLNAVERFESLKGRFPVISRRGKQERRTDNVLYGPVGLGEPGKLVTRAEWGPLTLGSDETVPFSVARLASDMAADPSPLVNHALMGIREAKFNKKVYNRTGSIGEALEPVTTESHHITDIVHLAAFKDAESYQKLVAAGDKTMADWLLKYDPVPNSIYAKTLERPPSTTAQVLSEQAAVRVANEPTPAHAANTAATAGEDARNSAALAGEPYQYLKIIEEQTQEAADAAARAATSTHGPTGDAVQAEAANLNPIVNPRIPPPTGVSGFRGRAPRPPAPVVNGPDKAEIGRRIGGFKGHDEYILQLLQDGRTPDSIATHLAPVADKAATKARAKEINGARTKPVPTTPTPTPEPPRTPNGSQPPVAASNAVRPPPVSQPPPLPTGAPAGHIPPPGPAGTPPGTTANAASVNVANHKVMTASGMPPAQLGQTFESKFTVYESRKHDRPWTQRVMESFVPAWGMTTIRKHMNVATDFVKEATSLTARNWAPIRRAYKKNPDELFRVFQAIRANNTTGLSATQVDTYNHIKNEMAKLFGSGELTHAQNATNVMNKAGLSVKHLNMQLKSRGVSFVNTKGSGNAPGTLFQFDSNLPIADQWLGQLVHISSGEDALRAIDVLHDVQSAVLGAVVERHMIDGFLKKLGSTNPNMANKGWKNLSHATYNNGDDLVFKDYYDGIWVPEDIANELGRFDFSYNEMMNLNSPGWLKEFDQALRLVKTGYTIYSPAHHWRNLIGDIFLLKADGGSVHKDYRFAVKMLRGKMKNDFENGYFRGIHIDEIMNPETMLRPKVFRRSDVQAHGRAAKNKSSGIEFDEEQFMYGAQYLGLEQTAGNIEDILYSSTSRVAQFMRDSRVANPAGGRIHEFASSASEWRDHGVRLAHFRYALQEVRLPKHLKNASYEAKQDYILREAAFRAKKWHPDGLDMTKFEQQVMKRIIPFYSWQRKAVPLAIETLVTNPRMVTLYPYITRNISVGMGYDAEEYPIGRNPIPSFLKGSYQALVGETPVKWEGDEAIGGGYKVATGPSSPFIDVLNYLGGQAEGPTDVGAITREIVPTVNPFIRIWPEMLLNANSKTGGPISPEGSKNSGFTNYAKYIGEQVPFVSWGTRWGTNKQPLTQDLINFLTAAGAYDTGGYRKTYEFEQKERAQKEKG